MSGRELRLLLQQRGTPCWGCLEKEDAQKLLQHSADVAAQLTYTQPPTSAAPTSSAGARPAGPWSAALPPIPVSPCLCLRPEPPPVLPPTASCRCVASDPYHQMLSDFLLHLTLEEDKQRDGAWL